MKTFRVREFKVQPMVEELADETAASEVAFAPNTDGVERLRSGTYSNSVWNCDGEILENPSIHVRVFRQIIQLFARGVEEEVYSEQTSCVPCGRGFKHQ